MSWGQDDVWETGVRYAGEFSGFKIAAGIAYGQATELKTATGQVGFECLAQGAVIIGTSSPDCEQVGGSVSIMHEPTGLYVNLAAGEMKVDWDADF